MTNLPKGLSQLRVCAIIYSISHIIAGTLYIPFWKGIPWLADTIAIELFKLPLERLPEPSERFWFVLVISTMYMIGVSGYLVWRDVKANANAWLVVIVSKGSSSFFYIVFFFAHVMSFSYIVGVLVDGPLFLIALTFWLKRNI